MSAHTSVRRGSSPVRVMPGVSRVVLEWGVSRSALGEHAPEGRAHLVTLRYEASPGSSERWTLIDPERNSERVVAGELCDSKPMVRNSGGCVLVRSSSMYAFVSIERDAPSLLYARTGVFASLGVGGGRYQPMGVRVIGS